MTPILRLLLKCLALICLTLPLARAELVVVVDARSPVTHLSQAEVVNIFMGRYRQLPGGDTAYPVDQPKSSEMRADFYQRLVEKYPSEINAYWARLHFSGAARPPASSDDGGEVLSYVLRTRGGIGYVERNKADSRFRVVLSLSP